MTKRTGEPKTASDVFREAPRANDVASIAARGTTANDVLGRLASGSAPDAFGRTSAAIDAATSAITGGSLFRGKTAAAELARLASGGMSDPFKGSTVALDAARAKIQGRQFGLSKDVIDAATGSFGGSVAKTLADMKGMKGFDAGTIDGIASRFDKLGLASSTLDDLIHKSDRDPLFGYSERETRMPELPPMPPNPLHRTNDLLDTMVTGLCEQREIIEASSNAQQRETELLATLVAAFSQSQVESSRAAKQASFTTWIGIAIGVAGVVVAIIALVLA